MVLNKKNVQKDWKNFGFTFTFVVSLEEIQGINYQRS